MSMLVKAIIRQRKKVITTQDENKMVGIGKNLTAIQVHEECQARKSNGHPI